MVQLKPKRDRKPKRRFLEDQSIINSSPSGKMHFVNGILSELASCLGELNRIHHSDGIAFQLLCRKRSLRPRIGWCCSYYQVRGFQPFRNVRGEGVVETSRDVEKREKGYLGFRMEGRVRHQSRWKAAIAKRTCYVIYIEQEAALRFMTCKNASQEDRTSFMPSVCIYIYVGDLRSCAYVEEDVRVLEPRSAQRNGVVRTYM